MPYENKNAKIADIVLRNIGVYTVNDIVQLVGSSDKRVRHVLCVLRSEGRINIGDVTDYPRTTRKPRVPGRLVREAILRDRSLHPKVIAKQVGCDPVTVYVEARKLVTEGLLPEYRVEHTTTKAYAIRQHILKCVADGNLNLSNIARECSCIKPYVDKQYKRLVASGTIPDTAIKHRVDDSADIISALRNADGTYGLRHIAKQLGVSAGKLYPYYYRLISNGEPITIKHNKQRNVV